MSTSTGGSSADTPEFAVAIDVTDLDASGAFYARFGFTTVHTSRAGMLLEERHLQSPEHRGVRIIIRKALGKRPVGTQPGTILRIALRVPDLKAALAGMASGIRWVGPTPTADNPGSSVRFIDPDGYTIELFQDTPGVGF